MIDLILAYPFWYVFVGLVSILVWLVVTGHAKFSGVGRAEHAGCVDKRVQKKIFVLGGSAGFTFGLQWTFLAGCLLNPALMKFIEQYGFSCQRWVGFCKTFAYVQVALSGANTLLYLAQISRIPRGHFPFKAHLQGCGFTTAWSPFWPLFWISKLPLFSWLGFPRDFLTVVNYFFSLPATIALLLLTGVCTGRWGIPVIKSVDVVRM